jgi:SAM-dependent methyltransferase
MNEMLLSFIEDYLATMEADETIQDRETALRRLRVIGLNDFSAVLWSMPLSRYPHISSLLPRMASAQVQRRWTGTDAATLLAQSLSFMRSVSCNYSDLAGKTIAGKRILDFGCGYGRLTRLCWFYSDDVWAVDPWDEALDLCREAGLTHNLYKSDELPSTLPVPEDFDVIIAFSVLTHTSERATKTVLKAMRKHLRPGGVACVTIRPIEYWACCYSSANKASLSSTDLEDRHRDAGFAFAPHNRQAVDGDITFGDTSMTLDWFKKNIPEWSIVAYDRSIDDPMQRYLFLQGA